MNTREAYYYNLGKKDALRPIKVQMLDKIHYYREILKDVLNHFEGGKVTSSQVVFTIKRELQINPEWEVLDAVPHFIPACQDPNAYKEIKSGPEPK